MKPRSIGTIFPVLLLAALPAAAQSAATDAATAELSRELQGIRQALDRMAGLLETVRRQQDVDLLLKRIELRERRLEPLERRVRSAESEIEGSEEHLRSLENMQEQQEDFLQLQIREGADSPLSETRRMLDDLERTRKSVEERMALSRMRMQEYENDLSRGREEIEILDDMLGELLDTERR